MYSFHYGSSKFVNSRKIIIDTIILLKTAQNNNVYLVKSHRKHKMRISLTTQGGNLPKCEHKSELIENTQMTALTETFSQSYVIMISLSPRLHYFNLFFKEEIVRLVHSSLDELETTLLVLSDEVFSELELLLGFLDDMNVFLEDSGLDEAFQLVGFHPLYQFENEALEARSNYTNRSPYPMIHIIREDSMEKAIIHYGEDKTERIPYDNIRKLELMSDEEFKEKILKYCSYQNLVQRK